jgi:hypothetical protein
LVDIFVNIKTIDRNIDFEYEEENPFDWLEDVKSNFKKILYTNTMEEKILKSLILGHPLNYAIKSDNTSNTYNLYTSSFKGMIMPTRFKSETGNQNILFYYNYRNIDDVSPIVNLNYVNPVNIEYFISCLPHIFNKIYFRKNIPSLINMNIDNKYFKEIKTMKLLDGPVFEKIFYKINNNKITISVWENINMPNLVKFFDNLRSALIY